MNGTLSIPTVGDFQVHTLSPLEEMNRNARRMEISHGQFGRLCTSPFEGDQETAGFYHALATLECAITEPPHGFEIRRASPKQVIEIWKHYEAFGKGSGEQAGDDSGS